MFAQLCAVKFSLLRTGSFWEHGAYIQEQGGGAGGRQVPPVRTPLSLRERPHHLIHPARWRVWANVVPPKQSGMLWTRSLWFVWAPFCFFPLRLSFELLSLRISNQVCSGQVALVCLSTYLFGFPCGYRVVTVFRAFAPPRYVGMVLRVTFGFPVKQVCELCTYTFCRSRITPDEAADLGGGYCREAFAQSCRVHDQGQEPVQAPQHGQQRGNHHPCPLRRRHAQV